jgi:hypothetical protein
VTGTDGPPRRSRAARIAQRALVVAVTLLVALLAAEVGLRVWLWAHGRPYDAQQATRYLQSLTNPIAAFVPGTVGTTLPDGSRRPILNPYYASEEQHDSGGVLAHFRERAQPGDYTVLVLGGSVAAFFGLTESEAIAQELARDPRLAQRRIVVLNGGHAAHKQPQQLNRVALLLSLGFRPDLVVNLDGFNESAIAIENGLGITNPAWPSIPVWGSVVEGVTTGSPERMDLMVELWDVRNDAQDLLRRTLDPGLQHSCLFGRYAVARLHALSRRRAELQQRIGSLESVKTDERMRGQVGGPDCDRDVPALVDLSVRIWGESSRSLRALCESRRIAYLHVLQPALFDTGSKPLSPDETRIENPNQAWSIGATLGYPKLRRAGQELAAGGEHFLDASRVFEGIAEQLYQDPVHFSPRGNALLRALVVRRILADVLPR